MKSLIVGILITISLASSVFSQVASTPGEFMDDLNVAIDNARKRYPNLPDVKMVYFGHAVCLDRTKLVDGIKTDSDTLGLPIDLSQYPNFFACEGSDSISGYFACYKCRLPHGIRLKASEYHLIILNEMSRLWFNQHCYEDVMVKHEKWNEALPFEAFAGDFVAFDIEGKFVCCETLYDMSSDLSPVSKPEGFPPFHYHREFFIHKGATNLKPDQESALSYHKAQNYEYDPNNGKLVPKKTRITMRRTGKVYEREESTEINREHNSLSHPSNAPVMQSYMSSYVLVLDIDFRWNVPCEQSQRRGLLYRSNISIKLPQKPDGSRETVGVGPIGFSVQ